MSKSLQTLNLDDVRRHDSTVHYIFYDDVRRHDSSKLVNILIAEIAEIITSPTLHRIIQV